MPDLIFIFNHYHFLSRIVAFKDLHRGCGDLEFLGKEFNESLICFSLNRWGSHFDLNPVSIGAHHLILGRPGLKVDLQNMVLHVYLRIKWSVGMTEYWSGG